MEQAEARRWKVCVDDSWEEKAFAEDAAGLLGVGCVWPPRSYSCTFCRREFRSAQALGGHMNVHRRDRARLKQYTTTQHHHHQTLDLHRYSPYRNHKQQDQSCCIKDNINPTFVSNTTAPSVHQTIYTPDQPQLVSSFVIKKDSKNLSFLCYNNDYESSNNKFSKSHDDDDEKVTSFINLSSGSSPTTDEDSELLMNCPKRRKLDKTNEGQASKTTDAPKFEYLDLELRLGDRPKVQ